MVVVACLAAMLASWLYMQATNKNNTTFQVTARRLFQLSAISVVSVFVILFYIIFDHRYEYYYAWKHSSNALPVYYMISCFWEGQEGSFLLWMFWNAVIGMILIRISKAWESPVMAVISLSQFALGTMLLGLKIASVKIGSSPFDLFREFSPEMVAGIPSPEGQAKYLMMLKDGKGLNPLLQNYWMVIHPPTLFLGFALAVVPFAYSIAGLWTRKYREWTSPALIWSLVCVGILGTGIIMGGFWAYESLSFGGYWAWDPVENASLMPWIIMASAAHMILITRNTGRHLFTSHLLIQLTFWLVLYASFLTRSGILGDASVHSFTDLGLSGQLLLFVFVFLLVSLISTEQSPRNRVIYATGFVFYVLIQVLAAYNLSPASYQSFSSVFNILNIALFFLVVVSYLITLAKVSAPGAEITTVTVLGSIRQLFAKSTEPKQDDEKWDSRELWMFLGSMFLILSLVQVFSATSIPVFNKIFGSTTTVPKADAYNRSQLWLAMPIMVLMGLGQWFRYCNTDLKAFFSQLRIHLLIAVVGGALLQFGFGIYEVKYVIFLYLALYLVVANVAWLRQNRKLSWLSLGASVAHAGFGILLIGVLVSSVKQSILSTSTESINLAAEFDAKGRPDSKAVDFNHQNRILYQNQPEEMGPYKVTYRKVDRGTGFDSINRFYEVQFEGQGNNKEAFILHPKTQNNPNMGLLAEPSTKHFISKDIFTHVNYESSQENKEPFSGFKEHEVAMGEAFLSESGKVKLRVDSLFQVPVNGGLMIRIRLQAERLKDKAILYTDYVVDTVSNATDGVPAMNEELGVFAQVKSLHTPDASNPNRKLGFTIICAEKEPVKPYVVLKVIEFPWINLVWAGTIIMVFGVGMALANRYRIQQSLS